MSGSEHYSRSATRQPWDDFQVQVMIPVAATVLFVAWIVVS